VPHVQAKYSIISAYFLASQRRCERPAQKQQQQASGEFYVVDCLEREGKATLN
jgi:hypothetical protein